MFILNLRYEMRFGEVVTSVDYLVSSGEQLLRNIETKRPGGLEVDHKLELDRELNRKLARSFTLQYAVHVGRGVPKVVDNIVSMTL